MPGSTSSSPADRTWAVVLAGGVGSRFWPVSTPERPKQILPLAGDTPLIADTVGRITPLVPLERVRVLSGVDLVGPIRGAVPELDDGHFLIEPRARGTAPVLVRAAHYMAARDPEAIMVSLHADHVIRPESGFRDTVAAAVAAAHVHDRLFSLGITPTRAETGYGYVRRGAALDDTGAHAVDRFVEKPDPDTAADYVRSGEYLWNSGIFIWRAARLLEEIRRHTPELAELLPLLDAGDIDAFFDRAPSLSIDEGIMERSERVGVIEAGFEWDDLGTWDAVARARRGDGRGNVTLGQTHVVDSDGCVVWEEAGEPVVVFGATDLVVVRARGVTLVLPRDRASDLKALLAELPDAVLEGPR
ncbi:MAG: mannose-1-phosphate guanyltransferase [Gemmatimonadetes bacterium]|nr:mannose-1-phosphate guanyltransferase [Gemmatimonadota bacterium]